MNVLVAVDGSVGSQEAIRQIGQLLSPSDAITLYYSPPGVNFPAVTEMSPEVQAATRQALADAVFNDAMARLSEPLRGSVRRLVGHQTARHGILLAAEEIQAELIVVGARGLSPVKELLLGSVSHSVAREAKVPVFVARAKSSGPTTGPYRAMIAVGSVEQGSRLCALARRFQWPAKAEVSLVRVIEPMFAGELPEWLEKAARDAMTEAAAQGWRREHAAEKQRAYDELQALAARQTPPLPSARPLVLEGDSAEQLLNACTAQQADLIVIGPRRLNLLERWMLGSTSENLLSHAPCSVLVAREKETA